MIIKEDQELSAWLSLCQTPNIGNKYIHFLLQHFENAAQIFDSKNLPLEVKRKDTLRLIERCRNHKSKPSTIKKVQQALDWRQQDNHHLISIHCDTYPPLLKEIPDPPLLLYIIGSLKALRLPQIAIVGSAQAAR
jgi:predicted Rossmann fold nucleotide-binding protein DprA/Smf involved in DNA uptake